MIPKIKKILYATDLSANANYAFGYALNVAMGNDAKLSIINVYEKHVSQTNITMRSNDFETAKLKLAAKIKADLALFYKKEQIEDGMYDTLIGEIYVATGLPVDAILAKAKANDYDLIVMGTHGHGLLFSALIGSTARKMVQFSEIPVLVVRLPEEMKGN